MTQFDRITLHPALMGGFTMRGGKPNAGPTSVGQTLPTLRLWVMQPLIDMLS
jgi:hypothetical protein